MSYYEESDYEKKQKAAARAKLRRILPEVEAAYPSAHLVKNEYGRSFIRVRGIEIQPKKISHWMTGGKNESAWEVKSSRVNPPRYPRNVAGLIKAIGGMISAELKKTKAARKEETHARSSAGALRKKLKGTGFSVSSSWREGLATLKVGKAEVEVDIDAKKGLVTGISLEGCISLDEFKKVIVPALKKLKTGKEYDEYEDEDEEEDEDQEGD